MIRTATHLSNNGMTFDNIKHVCLFDNIKHGCLIESFI